MISQLKKSILFIVPIVILLNIESNGNAIQKITAISSANNLPRGSINSITNDSIGFVWIGTWKGLYRYDGHKAVNFATINPDFKALKIETLLVDRHNLWVGTFVSGLFKIDLTTYKITRYNKSNDTPVQIINDNNIISICAMPDHRIIVGTERAGFNIIAPEGNVLKSFTVESSPSVLINNQVSSITTINDSLVAIGNYAFTIMNLNTYQAKQLELPVLQQHYSNITNINNNKFLFSTHEGLFVIDINTLSTEKIFNKRVKAITKKNAQELYLGSAEGLKVLDLKNYNISTPVSNNNTNPDLNINDLVYINDNTLLIGAENGLFSANYSNEVFNFFEQSKHTELEIVSAIDFNNEKILAGTWGNGIVEITPQTGVLNKISFTEYNPEFIFSLKKTDSKIWFSSKNDLGIYSFNTDDPDESLKHYPRFRNTDNTESMYTVTSSLITPEGLFVVGTWDGLLFYYDKKSDEFNILTDRQSQLPKSRNLSIFSLMTDRQGHTWIGLNGGGIIQTQLTDKHITNQKLITEKNGLVSNFVTCLFQSRNGVIWIGTEAGLSYIKNDTVHSVFHKDIIIDIQSITEDKHGDLWIGTQNGLVKINSYYPSDGYRLFNTNDGLSNTSFYLNSVTQNNDSLYFGGFNGIDYFNPSEVKSESSPTRPQITSFKLLNQDIYPYMNEYDDFLDKNIFNTNLLTLKHHQNTFSFEFSNLQFGIENNSQYAFKLDGVDDNWNYRDSKNRKAYYTKLAPGNYTFYVKSTNAEGKWSDYTKQLDVIISPPFWATTYAYIIYFIISMLVVFLLINRWFMKIQKKHQERLKDLEYNKQKELDELKLRFFTNISHEFRTPLTLILGPLKKILENSTSNPFHNEHLMIYRNTNRLLKLTNRIIDFRKNEKDQLKLKVEKTNLSDFCYNIFLFFNYEAQKRAIKYQFKTTFEEQILIDREFIESVLFNLISNAFKYTPDNSDIEIRVFRGTKNRAIIEVGDKGKGINEADIPHIFDRFYASRKHNSTGIGLSFSKRLIELHKGELNIESKPGKGSVFSIILSETDIYNTNEKAQKSNKEETNNWQGIDQEYMQQSVQSVDKIKSNYSKDELIALITDDNFEIRQYISSLLDENFTIIEAVNGREALKLAITNIPDIVISDVMMPEMDGFELCNALKNDEKTSHIPVILTTVLSEHKNRLKGLKKGADSYIPKPIDPEHLLIRVNKLIENRLKIKKKFHLTESSETTRKDEDENIDPFIEKARNVVLHNIDNSDYNINDFCDDMKLSRMQLYRKFKATTGLSANSFIRKVRMHYAAEKLKTGNYSVKEITYDVGFVDLKYFRKCFHDEFGMNPSEYAKQNNVSN
jgi:signal transduction histidine kinase/ligand-binding sensor domain-containing protein/AraC-like DNA-binding protein